MYRTCIFCSADLGTNDIIEEFPVGSRLAYDANRGRLWAICSRCGRWNLAPIEERWEAVEHAEEIFRGSRLRVQSENIGIARMHDGSRLVRIGDAVPGEIAAWRYGTELIRRRRKYYFAMGAVGVATVGMIAGMPLLAAAGVPTGLLSLGFNTVSAVKMRRTRARVIARLDPHASPTGQQLTLHQRDMAYARITNVEGDFAIALRRVSAPVEWYKLDPLWPQPERNEIVIRGAPARSIVSKTVVQSAGASKKSIASALDLLQSLGSAHAVLDAISRRQPKIGPLESINGHGPDVVSPQSLILGQYNVSLDHQARRVEHPSVHLDRVTVLALEMALHEESERRALEGELAELEDSWREAEMIARIADALPDEPPQDNPISISTATANEDATR